MTLKYHVAINLVQQQPGVCGFAQFNKLLQFFGAPNSAGGIRGITKDDAINSALQRLFNFFFTWLIIRQTQLKMNHTRPIRAEVRVARNSRGTKAKDLFYLASVIGIEGFNQSNVFPPLCAQCQQSSHYSTSDTNIKRVRRNSSK
jgi:hypothetical protein